VEVVHKLLHCDCVEEHIVCCPCALSLFENGVYGGKRVALVDPYRVVSAVLEYLEFLVDLRWDLQLAQQFLRDDLQV